MHEIYKIYEMQHRNKRVDIEMEKGKKSVEN
jgi:hypothetical protein